MPLYRVSETKLDQVPETTFATERLFERKDIQRLLKADVSVLANDLMVISEEYGDWEESSRRIDLLCLDRQAHLVVVELKRTDDGGHMELQALRYAAMVANMTVDQLIGAHGRYLGDDDAAQRAEAAILAFLNWETLSEGVLSDEVRVILVAANFSIELTTAVLWLNKSGLDLTCIRMKPYRLGADVLVDLEQIIPLPEAADYETKIRSQQREARRAESARYDIFRRFWAQLIERSRSRTSLVANRSTTNQHWLSGRVGRRGFELSFALAKESSRVECMIDVGKGGDEANLELFHALEAQRPEIEAVFGEELDWQPLEDSRACRISRTLTGGWRTAEGEWPELQERLIEAMVRLERALKDRILALPG